MVEVWKVISSYPNYSISNLGNVRNDIKNKLMTNVDNGLGYLRVGLTHLGVRKKLFVHRLVAFAFVENTENKPNINHIDRVKYNNCSTNLEWVTHTENMQHEARTSHVKTFRQFTKDDVENIRELARLGVSGNQLAKSYSADRSSIMRILQNKTHKEVIHG